MSEPDLAKQAGVQSPEKQYASRHEKSVAFQNTEAIPDADLEAGSPRYVDNSDSEEIIIAHELQKRSGFLRKLREGEEWLDSKIGIETRGVDRIREEDKKPPSKVNA